MKKITVTVGIPAFNEEQNIESFLRSLFEQKLQKVTLQKILVYSDCSDDKTNQIVKKLSKEYPIIELVEGKSRKGKYFRVSQMFALNKSDILIILDADIAFAKNNFLETLAVDLAETPTAVMDAAHIELVRPNGFLPKILHTNFVMWDYMRWYIKDYISATNFHGAATAYKYSFTKSTTIPQGLSDPHLYIYLKAKASEGFRYCYNAKILQYPPTTIADVKKILTRSIGKRDPKLEKIFGEKMIQEAFVIPTEAKIKGVLKSLVTYPFYTPLSILMNYYLVKSTNVKKISKSPVWDVVKSTKKPMSYAK